MSTALQSPSNMKETGLSWIPDIPSHWDVKRAKLILRELDSRSAKGDEVLLSVSQYTGVTPRRNRDNSDEQDTRSESLVGYKKVSTGDLVVNIMLAWNGSLGASNFDGVVSPAYCVYRFEGDNQPDYYHHLLRTDAYKGRIKVDSRGVVDSRLRLYSENLFRIELPVPPPDEQAQIVRFIRHLDQRVNRLIKTKRRLIELLNEQKQAIIHRAVTRGLDPTVPLKPSGIDWLGDMPAHWQNVALKRSLRAFIDCEHKTAPMVDSSPFLVVRTTAVRHGRLNLAGTYCTSEEGFGEWTKRGLPAPGDVIFTREAPAGEACIVPEGLSLCLGQRTVLMKLRKSHILPEFLVMQIYGGAASREIQLASQGSTVGHFNMSDIGVLPMLLPPINEQAQIVKEAGEQTRDFDLAIEKATAEIDLIREYRTRLVADVVTGQLDVRHLDLPEVEESLIEAIDAGDDGAAEETDEGVELFE